MRKIALVLLLSLPLAGCWNPFARVLNPVTSTNLYQAELVFDGAIKTFNAGKKLCIQRILPPVCRTYAKKGQGLIEKARDAQLEAEMFIDHNPTLDASSLVEAFKILVGQFATTTDNLSALK